MLSNTVHVLPCHCEFHLHVEGMWKSVLITLKIVIQVYSFFFQLALKVYTCLLLVPAKITEMRGEQTVHEGSNLQLTCKASGKPAVNITWTKERTGNQGDTGVLREGKVLTIKKISRKDSGTYNCSAYNGFGEADSRTVYVNVTCEYALKKLYYGAKQIGTFHLSFVL